MAFWTPQPGPQSMAVICPVKIIFFGGERGGGKSDAIVGRHTRGAEKWGRHWHGLIIRKKYKDFTELRRRWDELKAEGLPITRTGGDLQVNKITFDTGAVVWMVAAEDAKAVADFQGHQYTEVSIDEAPNIAQIGKMIEMFKGCLRSPHGVPTHMFLTGNPGGPGAATIKALFIDAAPPETVIRDAEGYTRVFIRSGLKDNKILCEADPEYVRALQSITDPHLRAAWFEGRWDVFVGQAFNFHELTHVIQPIPVPPGAPIYTTFDWGFGKPFSFGWWWVDADGRIYRFAEWYGCASKSDGTLDENVGLRLTDSEIAEGIIKRESELSFNRDNVIRLDGHDSFNKKPDYKGGGQGESTAEIFSKYGLYIQPADSSRQLKIRQFRERLRTKPDELPMLVVYDTCTQFIRTIPNLCVDEANPEDVDSKQEDHIYDEACQVCMARPVSLEIPLPRPERPQRVVDVVEGRAPASDLIEEDPLLARLRGSTNYMPRELGEEFPFEQMTREEAHGFYD